MESVSTAIIKAGFSNAAKLKLTAGNETAKHPNANGIEMMAAMAATRLNKK